jgi:glycosyltransferase involved in cell wall biosynthesis
MRILFLIRKLERGGAEQQLVTLVRHLDAQRFCVSVVTYYPGGELESELKGLPNVRLCSAGKRGRWDVAGFLLRLWKLVRAARPQVVHGYMYGANELALVFGRAVGARVIWGVRASGLDLERYDRATRALFRTGAWLSPRVDAIIANSEAGRRFHVGLGYPARVFVVIPNGIDSQRFAFSERDRQRVRAEWGIGADEALIGMVARLDPMKDHATFVRAAALLAGTRGAVRFAVIGTGSAAALARLQELAAELRIGARLVWAGSRRDMPAVYSALDLVTSTSAFGEGCSNALAEAMACEKLCVATDVGDARDLIGDTGEIVPPRDPKSLAQAWSTALDVPPEQRAARARRARMRVVEKFSVATLAVRTGEVLTRVGAPAGAAAP